MFEQVKKCFVLHFLVGMLMTGSALPAIAAKKDSIIGKVSNVKEGAGTLKIVKNIIDANAKGVRIRKKGKKSATLSDISVGDIVRIKGILDISGIIRVTDIKDPVKLKGYDALITGTSEYVNTAEKTFTVFGQKIDASNLSGINMSGMIISFSNMRSGVSVDVYVKAKGGSLLAQKVTIRPESCTFCHD
ncbi:MAG: hypothetical protein U0586_11165 [Candidatus Brocadiaceae bacterium]